MAIAKSTTDFVRVPHPQAATSKPAHSEPDSERDLAADAASTARPPADSVSEPPLERPSVGVPYRHDGPAVAACLGAVLADRRASLGLGPKQVAYRAWIHPSYLRALERGDRQPSVAVFIMLARSLGLDPRELLDGLLEKMHYGRGAPPGFRKD